MTDKIILLLRSVTFLKGKKSDINDNETYFRIFKCHVNLGAVHTVFKVQQQQQQQHPS